LPGKAAEAALERRKLWPTHGEHLGQVAGELAQAALLVRADDSEEAPARAAEIEASVRDTVQAAAASGADVAALRASKALSFLQDDAFWTNLGTNAKSVVQ
jgi:hypothetical protein